MGPHEDLGDSGGAGTWSRRVVIAAGAATLLAACSDTERGASRADGSLTTTAPSMTGSATTAPTTTAPAAPPVACALSPELTAGPYYLDGALARADITEGRPGTPLRFRVKVLALPDCAPLAGAAVDIWHCDAGGEYSGFYGNSLAATAAQGRNDKRFLRGVQVTNAAGVATFTTIFPGWYEGRTVHIHLKVIEGGSLGSTYSGGHVAHVGQAFFDETLTATLLEAEPYAAHTGTRTTNDEDSIYRQAGDGAITAMSPGSPATTGYVGTFTCMVDPTATPPAAPLF